MRNNDKGGRNCDLYAFSPDGEVEWKIQRIGSRLFVWIDGKPAIVSNPNTEDNASLSGRIAFKVFDSDCTIWDIKVRQPCKTKKEPRGFEDKCPPPFPFVPFSY